VLGHPAILGQHQQAHRIDVQPTGRSQATQMAGMKRFLLGSSDQWFSGLTSVTAGR
jgi:hypothetical protein